MQKTCIKEYQELEYPRDQWVMSPLNHWACEGWRLVNIRTISLPHPYQDQIRILLERDLYLTEQEIKDRPATLV